MSKSIEAAINAQPVNVIAVGTPVKIDQGFDTFTLGTVVSFDASTKNQMGFTGNYQIEITGGVDCMGMPAAVGSIDNVLHSNVVAA